MTTDPDPFKEGQRAARRNIPAEGNPCRDGSDEHSLWASALAELAQGPWQALQASETAFGRSVALRSRPAAHAGGDAPEGDFDRDNSGRPNRISARGSFGASSRIERVVEFSPRRGARDRSWLSVSRP